MLFKYFGGLGPDIARTGLRKLILSILAAWASGDSFWVFGQPSSRKSQNGPRETHFKYFGGLGLDIARMSLRRFFLGILAAWA